ncbi:MAG: hypothetical protein PVJ49_03500 [Acidobacteriota bacterium]|jgi:hypothetical protein
MSDRDDEQYYLRVERHFGRRRGGPLVLSPKDWRLLEDWRAQGIPLRIVLRGINEAFDRFAAAGPRPDRINSLRYCEQEVQAAWQEYRTTRRRSDEDTVPAGLPDAAEHLRAVATACRSAADGLAGDAAACLRSAADELEALAVQANEGALGARRLDERCNELEEGLRAELAKQLEATPSIAALRLPQFSPFAAR